MILKEQWINKIMGSGDKVVLNCEKIPRREARRSLVITRNMKAGEVITEKDLMAKRPGTGISPQYIDVIIGRHLATDIDEEM